MSLGFRREVRKAGEVQQKRQRKKGKKKITKNNKKVCWRLSDKRHQEGMVSHVRSGHQVGHPGHDAGLGDGHP